MNPTGIANEQKNNHNFDPVMIPHQQLHITINKNEEQVIHYYINKNLSIQPLFPESIISITQCPILIQNEIQSLLTSLWHSKAILLSQVINYRLNLPRKDERRYHSDYVKQVSMNFQIERWEEYTNLDSLYEMSLTGHLIRSIACEGGKTTLNNLIQITEPFLPYLRKLNGKNFSGTATRTVKGCLSAVVFKRDGESNWSINEGKVQDFIKQANEKLYTFFEKLKRNFPKFEEVRVYNTNRKIKRKKKEEAPDRSNIHLSQYKKSDKINLKMMEKKRELDQLIQTSTQGLNLGLMNGTSEKCLDQTVISKAEKIFSQQHLLSLELQNQSVSQASGQFQKPSSIVIPDFQRSELKKIQSKFDFLSQKLLQINLQSKEEPHENQSQHDSKIDQEMNHGLEYTTSQEIQLSLKMQSSQTEKITPYLLGLLIGFNWMKDIRNKR